LIATKGRVNSNYNFLHISKNARERIEKAQSLFVLIFIDGEEKRITLKSIKDEIKKENARREIENEITRMKKSLMGDELDETDKICLFPLVERKDVKETKFK